MASSELLLISKVLETKDIDTPIKAGVKAHHFTGTWTSMWEWMILYYRDHGVVPTERALVTEFGSFTPADTDNEVFSRLIEELVRNHQTRVIADSLTSIINAVDGGDPDKAISEMVSVAQKAKVEASRIRDVNIIETWEERLKKYEEMSQSVNSLRGIPTGFYGLDRITQGLRPQQFIVLAGEPKRGKSLFALIMANSAHIHGKTPLFVSFEMSVDEQVARYDSLISKIPYTRILSGDLSKQDRETIRRAVMSRKNMHPFIISEDTSSLTTVTALSGKVREYSPDVLVVDGVYLMDDEEGQDRGTPQALTNITRGLKRLAQSHDIPVVATTQVLSWKLQNRRTRAVTADAIGYSSSFGQDADLVLGVERNPDIDDQAIMRVLMARSAPQGIVHVKWDWQNMSFEEVFGDDDDNVNPSFD